jgi:FkbM family methyltransferase
MIKEAIRSLLAAADLRVTRNAKLQDETSLERSILTETQRIGALGAAEVFSHYVRNGHQLENEKDLSDFLRFYSEHWMLSASQWSQDIFVMFATHLKRNGQFLEIGGADGYTHSNTYSLERHWGWTGTLVEPDPSQFDTLRRSRPGNILLNAAIIPNGTSEFVMLRRVGQLSAIDGYEGQDVHYETRMASQDLHKVNSISLTDLLRQTQYDYFSLDVEGAEFEILKNVDWRAIRKPSCLTVEHNFRETEKVELLRLLTDNGYVEFLPAHPWLRRGDIWAVLSI